MIGLNFTAIITGETIGGIVALTAWLLLPWAVTR